MIKINYFFSAAFLLISTISFGQLSGTFTVGTPSSTYPTLTAAVTALQISGVGAGGVTLNIAPGIYQENIVLGGIAGIGQASPLIIVATPETVTFEGIGTSTSSDAVFLINALSYVTIDGINIEDKSPLGLDAEIGIRFFGATTAGCQNNTVRNCTITMGRNGARPSSSSRGIVFLSRATSAAAANNNNVVDNVKIDNSSWGIQFSCAANFFGQISFPDFNNAVINSTFGSVLPLGHDFSSGALAINALGGRNMLIENNVIAGISNLNSAPALPVSTSGISMDSSSGIIRNNTIKNLEYQGTIGAVFGIRSSTFLGDETLIANNSISNLKRSNFVASTTDPSLTITGIWIFNQSGNNGLAKVLHNSIFLTSDTDVTYSSGGINLSGGSTGNFPADVYNNIVVNNIGTSSASYRSFALVDGNTTRGSLRSNNNVLFANGTNGFLGAIGRELGGTEQFSNTLSLFQTFSLTNGESVNFLPAFANTAAGDLSILASAANPANYLVPILANVPADIGGTIRFTPLTFAGAYEGVASLSSADVRKLELKIFPNPALNQLNIANSNGGTLNSVKIYSVLGAEVISLNLNSSNFQSEYQINVSTLNAGMYIIQIESSEGSTTRKFVKN
jgi:hypothetical protein